MATAAAPQPIVTALPGTATTQPGVRLVDGVLMYSAAWLSPPPVRSASWNS